MDGIAVAGEVVTAATALAGLILVYLGGLATAYGTFEATEKKSVKGRYQKRAWLAFVGLSFALVAAVLGVIGKWTQSGCIANASVVLLMVSFIWGLVIALLTVHEVE